MVVAVAEEEDHPSQKHQVYQGEVVVVAAAAEGYLLPGHRTSQAVEGVGVAGDLIRALVALWMASRDWGLLEAVVLW